MPDPEQATFGSTPTRLTDLVAEEPIVDGVIRVLVTSSTNSRSSYHKQDAHDPGDVKCDRVLRADHTEWILKPKKAMQSSSATACDQCYPEGDA